MSNVTRVLYPGNVQLNAIPPMVFYYFAYGVHLYLRVVYFHESLNVLNLHTFVFCFESTDDNNDGICAVPKSGTWCYDVPKLAL